MEALLLTLLLTLVILAGVAIAGYFVLRWLFTRASDRMAHHIARGLGQLATTGAAARVGRAAATATRAAAGQLTWLGAYAVAQGVSEEAARAEFQRSIERTSRIMDSAIRLPIVGGVGLDAVLGLFPVAGDTVSALISISLIGRSLRYGIPHDIVTKMLANVLVDLLLGAIPIIGDLADMWFRSNERNSALLKEYLGDEARVLGK